MKRVVLLLLFAIFIQNLPAQNGGLISGTVTEKSSGRTLPGAMLTLNKLNRYTISDKNGYFGKYGGYILLAAADVIFIMYDYNLTILYKSYYRRFMPKLRKKR